MTWYAAVAIAADKASHRSAGVPLTRIAVAGATTIATRARTPPARAAARYASQTGRAWPRYHSAAQANSARVRAVFWGMRYVSDRPPATNVVSAHKASAR